MKKLLLFTVLLFFAYQNYAFANLTIFDENKKFGIKDKSQNVIVEAKYNKIIRLGDNAFIVQKKSKFGIIDKNGNILVPAKYRHAERVLGKYAKLGNYGDFGLYDETGFAILPPSYDSIELLFGGMLLTYDNYLYGVSDFKGRVLLENKFDDIYMPKPNIMRIQYQGQWYEIEQVSSQTLTLPEDITAVKGSDDFKVTNIVVNTGVVSGYSVLTFTDYLIKLISSISPAHEDTIDQLMFSQGAETVSIFVKLTWLPMYPVRYARNYYKYIRNPNNGPLSTVRNKLKSKMK
ncbi:MAG: WG repeat-containing protein [Candidatus Gastranaerophilales bacterium]|nr:WG repeat-containing protein [Candidatus Gastranaerophilales bacterium]